MIDQDILSYAEAEAADALEDGEEGVRRRIIEAALDYRRFVDRGARMEDLEWALEQAFRKVGLMP